MKRFLLILFCIAAISGAVFYLVSVPGENPGPEAVGGVLDLRGEDFTRNVFSLDGEWEFYWRRLYTPDDFADGPRADRSPISLPAPWTAAGYPTFGFATYRLVILTGNVPYLMIHVPEITSAAVVYINGERVLESGRVAVSRSGEIPARRSEFFDLPAVGGRAEIVVQASNFERLFVSGLRFGFQIGRGGVLLRSAFGRWAALTGVAGAFVVMGLYHLVLYLFRHHRRDVVYPLYAVSCLDAALRFLIEPNGPLPWLVSSLSHLWFSLSGILMVVQTAVLVPFSLIVFGLRPSRVLKAACTAVFLLLAVSQLAFPSPLKFRMLYLNFVPAVLVLFPMARSLTPEHIRNRPWSVLYFAVLTFHTVWTLFATVFLEARFFVPVLLSHVSLMLSQFVILSQDYAEARRRADELTEENRMLDRLNAMKNRFWGNVGHEMRTPLAVISAHAQVAAEMLRQGKAGQSGEKVLSALNTVTEEANRVARMARDAMDLASARDAAGSMEKVDLGELLKATAETCLPLLEKRGNRLTLDVPDKLPPVLGDADRLTQVVINLISNANEHTKDGRITVRANREIAPTTENSILTEISDTGTGIAADLIPKVFERGVKDAESEGGGLGLALCRAIVESHGGTIGIDSAPDRGTRVFFHLPAFVFYK